MEQRILKVVWKDGVTNAEVRQRTYKKDTVAAAHCLKWKWGGHMVRMDQCKWAQAAPTWSVGTGKRENWATEEPMVRHVQEGSWRTVVTNSQYPV
jgi:hypothetical protein